MTIIIISLIHIRILTIIIIVIIVIIVIKIIITTIILIIICSYIPYFKGFGVCGKAPARCRCSPRRFQRSPRSAASRTQGPEHAILGPSWINY